MRKILYITSNHGKFEEAKHILEEWDLIRVDIDLPELQDEPHTIVREKAREALRQVGQPLIVEDVSLRCAAIHGLPGPYVKYFLKKLGHQGLYELIHKYHDHRAEVVCTTAYIEPDQEPALFEGSMHGKIVAPRGELRHGTHSWNSIFLPDGSNKTFGEMTFSELSRISMRSIALKKLKQHLEK